MGSPAPDPDPAVQLPRPFFLLCIIVQVEVNAACLLRLEARLFQSPPHPQPSPVTQLETTAMRVLCWLWALVSSAYWLSRLAVTLQSILRLCGKPTLGGPQDLLL